MFYLISAIVDAGFLINVEFHLPVNYN